MLYQSALVISTLLFSVVLANVGFEFQFALQPEDSAQWDQIGRPYTRKTIGIGPNAWWDLQLDVVGENKFEAEIVFPASRLRSGMPDEKNAEMISQQICPAFQSLWQFTNDLSQQLSDQFHALSSSEKSSEHVYSLLMPGWPRPVHLSFSPLIQTGPAFKLPGFLQATVGLHPDLLMSFLAKTFEDPESGIYSRLTTMLENMLISVSQLPVGPSAQAIVWLLSSYYFVGNFAEGTADYLKYVALVMARTNLGQVYESSLSDEDKQFFANQALGKWIGHADAEGRGLYEVCKRVLKELDAGLFVSTRVVKGGMWLDDVRIAGPLMSDLCVQVSRGDDQLWEYDDSMSAQDFEGELVVEFRAFNTFGSSSTALGFALDFYRFVVEFKASQGQTGFVPLAGAEICDLKASPQWKSTNDIKVWFIYRTTLVWEDTENVQVIGKPSLYKRIGSGLGGFWFPALIHNVLVFEVPSPKVFPSGLGVNPLLETDIAQSLYLLQQFAANLEKDSQSNPIIKFQMPGMDSDEELPPIELNVRDPYLRGLLSTLVECPLSKLFAVVQLVLASSECTLQHSERLGQFMEAISLLPISTSAHAFLLLFCSQHVFSQKAPVSSQRSYKHMYQALRETDHLYFKQHARDGSHLSGIAFLVREIIGGEAIILNQELSDILDVTPGEQETHREIGVTLSATCDNADKFIETMHGTREVLHRFPQVSSIMFSTDSQSEQRSTSRFPFLLSNHE